MKKKDRQRVKKANKLLISALTLGALVSPVVMNPAFAETGTLDRVKETSKTIINTIEFPVNLTTDEPSGEHVTIKIDGVTYYSTSPLPSNVKLKDLQNLINTGSVALKEIDYGTGKGVFVIPSISKAYSYDSSKLPTSAYKITNGTASDYNFSKTDGTTTSYFKINPKTDKTHYEIGQTSGGNTPDFVIKNLGIVRDDGYTITGKGDSHEQITELSSISNDIGTADSPKVFRELSKTNNHGGAIWNSAVYNHHVYADFVQNHVTSDTSHIMGGAIYNCEGTSYGVIDSIIGDFIGNHANYNGTAIEQNALGGAIYNNQGTISNITGNFVGNYTYTDSSKNSAYGGAISNTGAYSIYTDVIANITGDFIGNYVKGSFNARGGAISNTTFTKIENITGDFIGNYADGAASGAQGGAIYNVTSTINNITGDFIGNYVDAPNNTLHFGGAIYSEGANDYAAAINNITGDFIGNHAKSGGGAIANLSYSTITNITGDFINNYASGDDIAAKGGAIYKEGGTIKNIKGNFINNYVDGSNDSNDSDYNGGAIFNGGAIAIENIIGHFTGNHAKNSGGAIFNDSNAKITNIEGNFTNNYTNTSGGAIYNKLGTISNITGKFEGNYVSGSYAFGGAIYNNGLSATIGNITGNFIGNYANATKDAAAKGGAIYNNFTISDITGDFIGNYANAKEFGTSVRIAHGGAIYNVGTIKNITGDFINNYVSGGAVFGGAIYNDGSKAKITIHAPNNENINKDIKFENNYVTSKTNGSSGGAIYNTSTGTINLLADTGRSITFVGGADTTGKYDIDGIYNAGSLNINGDGTTTTTGTVNVYKVNGTGTTNVYGGTLTAKGDFTQSALDVKAGTLDLAKNNLNTINVTTLSIADAAKLIIDVDLQNKTGDYFNSDKFVINNGIITTGTDGLTISSVNFLNGYKTITDGAKIELFQTSGSTDLSGLKIKDYAEAYGTTEDDAYTMVFRQDATNAGVLNVIKETPSSTLSLPDVIQANTNFYGKDLEISKYNIVKVEDNSYNLKSNLGTLTNYGSTPRNLTINGNGHVIQAEHVVGTKYSGVIVGAGQTLTVNNALFYTFGAIKNSEETEIGGSVINNSGTVNLNNSQLSYGQADNGGAIYNNAMGTLNIADGNFISNKATKNGGAIYNEDGVINNLSGKFENNTASENGGAIYSIKTYGSGIKLGNITADFTGNEATNGNGGAIYNKDGLIENLSGNFTRNKAANGYGGAIYNITNGSNEKIKNITGNFIENEAQMGGAIYNYAGSTIENITGNFENNKASTGGAIFNNGTLSINAKDSDIKFEGNSITGFGFGGAIYNDEYGIINLLADAGRKITFVGGADDNIDSIYNAGNGTLNINGKGTVGSETQGIIELSKVTDNETTPSGITNIYGGTINAKGTFNQASLTVNNANFVANENVVTNTLSNVNKSNLIANKNVEVKTNLTINNSKMTVNGTLKVADANLYPNSILKAEGFTGKITVESSELILGQTAINESTTTPIQKIYMDTATLNLQNNSIGILNVEDLQLYNNNNLMLDADLANKTMDQLKIKTLSGDGNINISDIHLLSDATEEKISLDLFADDDTRTLLANKVTGNLTGLKYSPIYKYNADYDSETGMIGFTRFAVPQGGNEADIYNPAILPSPVAAQMSGYATMMANFDQGFKTVDNMMNMPSMVRKAYIDRNKYALADETPVYTAGASKSAWVSPYTSFENVKLDNGPDVDAITYGSYFGGDSEVYSLRHGWDAIYSLYAGYNGAYQTFEGVNMNYNGGSIGASANFFKGNFFTAINLAVGAGVSNANTMYGPEYSTLLNAGAAVKAGYNFEFKNGLHILQPSLMIGYSLVNTFDYTNAAGVDITSDPLHAIVIQPQLKYILNLKNGWQPYAAVSAVFNIMDKSKFYAQDIALPEMSMRPYLQYGIGVQKQWGDRCTGYAQAMVRNIGRNGVALSLGFKWQLGKGSPSRL